MTAPDRWQGQVATLVAELQHGTNIDICHKAASFLKHISTELDALEDRYSVVIALEHYNKMQDRAEQAEADLAFRWQAGWLAGREAAARAARAQMRDLGSSEPWGDGWISCAEEIASQVSALPLPPAPPEPHGDGTT